MRVLVGILIAGVGVLFGYIVTSVTSWRERQAKRKLLLATLKYELRRVKATFPAYQRDQVFHRDPLRLTSLDELINGGTLSYRKDAVFLRELLLFRVAITRYNDFVSITNLIQNFATMPDDVHEQIFNHIAEYHQLVRDLKAQLLAVLPSDVREIGQHDA